MSELVLIALAVVAPVVLANWYPNATRRWFYRLLAARRLVFGALTVAFAFIFIGTGSFVFMIVGAGMLAVIVLAVLYEEPHKEVLGWLDV